MGPLVALEVLNAGALQSLLQQGVGFAKQTALGSPEVNRAPAWCEARNHFLGDLASSGIETEE
jgi:hypothetical protein